MYECSSWLPLLFLPRGSDRIAHGSVRAVRCRAKRGSHLSLSMWNHVVHGVESYPKGRALPNVYGDLCDAMVGDTARLHDGDTETTSVSPLRLIRPPASSCPVSLQKGYSLHP